MLRRIVGLSLGCGVCWLAHTSPTMAHGANITYESKKAMEITAKYDSGEPMKNAQVVIYAPNNPAEPWQKGMTDEQGKFVFMPDSEIDGNWNVKVRLAGHGSTIDIPLKSASTVTDTQEENVPSTNSQEVALNQSTHSSLTDNASTTTPLQKVMMAVVGVWGFIGTALFFARK